VCFPKSKSSSGSFFKIHWILEICYLGRIFRFPPYYVLFVRMQIMRISFI
jgi:hypothetical protein